MITPMMHEEIARGPGRDQRMESWRRVFRPGGLAGGGLGEDAGEAPEKSETGKIVVLSLVLAGLVAAIIVVGESEESKARRRARK